jgi:hypothetical protein
MTPVEQLTHDDIAEIGARWLKNNGYKFAFHNMTSAAAGEQPDALGMKAWGESFLLEAKVSRADFLADKKKPWRSPEYGAALGDNRGYITPKGLLKPEEIPYGWWLLEVHGKNKPMVKVIKGRVTEMKVSPWHQERGRDTKTPVTVYRNCDVTELSEFRNKGCRNALLTWMCSMFSRAEKDGIDLQRYANGKIVNERFR